MLRGSRVRQKTEKRVIGSREDPATDITLSRKAGIDIEIFRTVRDVRHNERALRIFCDDPGRSL